MPDCRDTSQYSYGRELCSMIRDNTGAEVFTVCSTKHLCRSPYEDDYTVLNHHFNFIDTTSYKYKSRVDGMKTFLELYDADRRSDDKYSVNNAIWSFHHVLSNKDAVLYQVSVFVNLLMDFDRTKLTIFTCFVLIRCATALISLMQTV